MVQLQKDLKDIEAAGIKLVAISYDSVDALRSYAEEQNIEYLMLSDEGSKTIDAYGIRNTEASSRIDGIPYPGTYLLDGSGVVRAKFFIDGYQQRHSDADLIKAAKELD